MVRAAGRAPTTNPHVDDWRFRTSEESSKGGQSERGGRLETPERLGGPPWTGQGPGPGTELHARIPLSNEGTPPPPHHATGRVVFSSSSAIAVLVPGCDLTIIGEGARRDCRTAGVWLWMFGVRSEPADAAIAGRAGCRAATSNPGAISPQAVLPPQPKPGEGGGAWWERETGETGEAEGLGRHAPVIQRTDKRMRSLFDMAG